MPPPWWGGCVFSTSKSRILNALNGYYLSENLIEKHVIFESIHSIRFKCRFTNKWSSQLIAGFHLGYSFLG